MPSHDPVLTMYLHTLIGHVNNLYNTTFWALVHSGLSPDRAEASLKVRTDVFVHLHTLDNSTYYYVVSMSEYCNCTDCFHSCRALHCTYTIVMFVYCALCTDHVQTVFSVQNVFSVQTIYELCS